MSDMAALSRRAAEARTSRYLIQRSLRDARDIRTARRQLADVLEDPPEAVERMLVTELLMEARRIGRHRARRYLREAGVGALSTVGEITERQRTALVDALRSDL